MLLSACSVACAGALSAPAQAEPERAATAPQQQVNAPARAQDPAPRPNRATVGGPQLAARGVAVNYRSARAARLPVIPASSYVVADARTGQVLAAKDAHGMFRPASTLKVLTAIALIPRLNPDATVVASPEATNVTPNVVGLVPGQRYKVSDLFSALLLISANDAAIALAEATGSLGQGVALMNAEASHLQAYDVVAKDPNGLDAPGQHTSAYDLALIGRQALTMPAFMKYDTVEGGLFPIKAHKSVGLWNQNGLLTQYRGGIGGKIGWTSAAGATYVGMARRGGTTLIVTLLHCPALTEITSAEKLLDWGFAQDGKASPVGTLVPPLAATAVAGHHASAKPTAPATLRAHDTATSRSALTSPIALTGIALGGLVVLAATIGFARARRSLGYCGKFSRRGNKRYGFGGFVSAMSRSIRGAKSFRSYAGGRGVGALAGAFVVADALPGVQALKLYLVRECLTILLAIAICDKLRHLTAMFRNLRSDEARVTRPKAGRSGSE